MEVREVTCEEGGRGWATYLSMSLGGNAVPNASLLCNLCVMLLLLLLLLLRLLLLLLLTTVTQLTHV